MLKGLGAINQLRNRKGGRGGHQKDYTLITDYTCTKKILMQRRLYINKAHTNFSYFLMQDFTLAGAVGGLNSLSYAHTQ